LIVVLKKALPIAVFGMNGVGDARISPGNFRGGPSNRRRFRAVGDADRPQQPEVSAYRLAGAVRPQ
jgi:hypothetical protein